MPGVTERTVSSNNWDMAFKALEELTVGREKNRGTIEVVKRGGLNGMVEGDAGAVTLKCSNHHFYSRSLDTVSDSQARDLNKFVTRTVIGVLDELKVRLGKDNSGNKDEIGERIDTLELQILDEIDQFSRPERSGSNRTMIPLSREQIRTIVLQVNDFKSMTAERLLDGGIDSLENIKDWAKGELGKLPPQTTVRAKFSALLTAFVARPDVARAAALGKAERGVDVLDSFLGSAMDTINRAKSDDAVGEKLADLLETSSLDACFPGITKRIDSILKLAGGVNLKPTDVRNEATHEQDLKTEVIAPQKPDETRHARPTKSLLLDDGDEGIRKEAKVVAPQQGQQGADPRVKGGETREGDIGKGTEQAPAPKAAANLAVGKTLPRAVTGKKISAKEEKAALEYMKGKDEELAKLIKGVTNSQKRTEILSKFMKACFDDQTFRRNSAIAARALGLGILTKADIKAAKVNKKGLPLLEKLGRQNFVNEIGSTDAVAAKYKQAHPEAKVCAQDFADNTLTFGGIFKNWTTQEEVLFRQVGLATFGPLFDHELTEPRGKDEYVYTTDAKTRRTKVMPAEGYLIKGRQDRVGGVSLEKNLDMYYLVSCAPSFPTSSSSFDPHNNAQCAITTFKKAKKTEPSSKQYENGVAMLKRVWELKGLTADLRNKMQKVLMFTSEIDLFNLKPQKQDAVLTKLADDIKKRRYDELLAKIDADDGSYDQALQARFDGWVQMCAAADIDYLIAGPIGTGAFGNATEKIACAFARAWVKYGKGDFINCQYSADSKKAEIFRKAFEEAQRMRVKLLEEDGYEAAEIVAALRAGGYAQEEVEQLLRNAGHTDEEIKKLLSPDVERLKS